MMIKHRGIMSDINPTPPIPPRDKQSLDAEKKPKDFSVKGPSGSPSKGGTFGKGGDWFPNATKKQKAELQNNLCQSISNQITQEKAEDEKAARKLKASEQGEDPDDVE